MTDDDTTRRVNVSPAEYVRLMRHRRGMSLRATATAMNALLPHDDAVSFALLSRWECGDSARMTTTRALALARVLDADPYIIAGVTTADALTLIRDDVARLLRLIDDDA